jgi:thioredoxin 1
MKHVLFLAAVVAATGCGGESPSTNGQKTSGAETATYPTSTEGLRRLMQDLCAARAESGQERYGRLIDGLVLPDPDRWFGEVFGENGRVLSNRYSEMASMLGLVIGQALDTVRGDGSAPDVAVRIDALDKQHATDLVKRMVDDMKESVVLYEAAFTAGMRSERLRYFAVDSGAWRCVGKVWPAFRNLPVRTGGQTGSGAMHAEEAEFDNAISRGVTIVHFGASSFTWMFERQESILKEVAQQLGDRARVLTVDIDKSPTLGTRFRIESAPTVIVFKDGQPAETFHGVTQADRLVAAVEGLR